VDDDIIVVVVIGAVGPAPAVVVVFVNGNGITLPLPLPFGRQRRIWRGCDCGCGCFGTDENEEDGEEWRRSSVGCAAWVPCSSSGPEPSETMYSPSSRPSGKTQAVTASVPTRARRVWMGRMVVVACGTDEEVIGSDAGRDETVRTS